MLRAHGDETDFVELCPEMKLINVTAALTRGALSLLRDTAVNWGSDLGMIAPIRYLSCAINIALSAAALLLFAILPSAACSNGWLWLKLALLIVSIGLATLALKSGRPVGIRHGILVTAIAVYTAMYFNARTHDPIGPVKSLVSPLR